MVARRAAFAALLLALLVAAAFADVLFGGRTLSPAPYLPGVTPSGPLGAPPPPPTALRDLEGGAWVDEPAPYLVHRALAEGRLPLWNAGVALGAPLAANPNMAAWSPLQLLPNLHPTPLVQDVAWVLRVYMLALATWLLASTLGCGHGAALVAAAALSLSGQTLDWVVHHPLNTDAFVPAALAAALCLLRGEPRALPALALAVAALLAGVKPQSALTSAAFGGAVLAAAVVEDRALARREPGRRVRLVTLALLLGAALAACALIPFLESYLAASGLVRAGRSTQSEWTLPAATLPGLAGPWALRVFAGADVAPSTGPPHAGLTVLVLALVGLARARRRAVAWVLAVTVALYLARIFGALPIPLAGVPILGSINYVKYCFPLYLALALLAGLALAPATARGAARPVWRTLAGALLVGELLLLAARERPLRIDPYRPAPYVEALRNLIEEAPGRISGPVALAPPLVSNVLGLRDLRAIDVLTPKAGYDFVSQTVAPSEGVVWILADPDPLAAATSPGASVADLRWILAREEIDGGRLPGVVRSQTSMRRLLRLFATLDVYRIDTAALGGGIRALDGDRRFHWSCATPCRFELELARTPADFVAGFAAAEALRAEIELRIESGGEERRTTSSVALGGNAPWQDVWLESPRPTDAPASVVVDVRTDEPATVFVGGIGPTPGGAREATEALAELAFRRGALERLRLRYADDTARIYENTAALGEAYLASEVARARDLDEVRGCLLAHAGRAVACVADPDALPAASAGEPGEIRIVDSRDASLGLETGAAREALLVVSRLHDPGWTATLDGKPTDVVRVNGAMMGVVVPAGAHRLELRYRPWSLAAGGAVSIVALLVLLRLVVPRREKV